MPVPLCFADTETTDIGHRRLPWEIAVIRREPDGTRREYHAFVAVDLSDASPFALKVGRFYDRHPLGRYLSGQVNDLAGPGCLLAGPAMRGGVMASVAEVIADPPQPGKDTYRQLYLSTADAALAWCRWTHGAHVIGAVPNFDTEVMESAARGVGLLPAHHYHLCDVENLIVGYLLGVATAEDMPRLRDLATPPWKSDDLFAELGVVVPEEARHTALGDARGVELAWDVVMGGA